jgi:hypothetical protein
MCFSIVQASWQSILEDDSVMQRAASLSAWCSMVTTYNAVGATLWSVPVSQSVEYHPSSRGCKRQWWGK